MLQSPFTGCDRHLFHLSVYRYFFFCTRLSVSWQINDSDVNEVWFCCSFVAQFLSLPSFFFVVIIPYCLECLLDFFLLLNTPTDSCFVGSYSSSLSCDASLWLFSEFLFLLLFLVDFCVNMKFLWNWWRKVRILVNKSLLFFDKFMQDSR